MDDKAEKLSLAMVKLKMVDGIEEEAATIRDEILPRMNELRVAADEVETVTAAKYWPFPTYGELLFGLK